VLKKVPIIPAPDLRRLQLGRYAQAGAIGIIPITRAPSYNINPDLSMRKKPDHNWVLTIIPAPSCNFNLVLRMRQKADCQMGFDDYSSAQCKSFSNKKLRLFFITIIPAPSITSDSV
jgi:hypothetical protein